MAHYDVLHTEQTHLQSTSSSGDGPNVAKISDQRHRLRRLLETNTRCGRNSRLSQRISTGAGECVSRRRRATHQQLSLGFVLRGGIYGAAIIWVIEMAGARSEAVAVFRTLMRTRRQCFAGDPDLLAASAKEIRKEFEANRNVGPGEELESLISKAREGVEFMRVNIVQAKLNERGNYEMKVKPEHQGGELEPV
ncbi:hypothetical protein M758_7G033300 [Ceratodon purpureus]|nr:hypothetical protein M758_7G033300 [Ceratodon purpureus]